MSVLLGAKAWLLLGFSLACLALIFITGYYMIRIAIEKLVEIVMYVVYWLKFEEYKRKKK